MLRKCVSHHLNSILNFMKKRTWRLPGGQLGEVTLQGAGLAEVLHGVLAHVQLLASAVGLRVWRVVPATFRCDDMQVRL